MLNLNQVVIDKDKIENNDPETDLVVHAFRYKENGQHEVVSTLILTYQQLKECCECQELLKVMNEDSNAYLQFNTILVEERQQFLDLDYLNCG